LSRCISSLFVSQSAEPPIDSLKRLQALLIRRVHDWNEQELKMQFIGPILNY